MTGPVRANFRGARALLMLPDDANRAVLARTLERLGLQVILAEATDDGVPAADILFVDADQDHTLDLREVPHIAVIGSEAPSRLTRVARHRAAAYLMKPVRATGIFTALFLAFNEQASRQREAQERQNLLRRAEGRRNVVKAIITLMQRHGLSDDDAYRELRLGSMKRRIPIEDFAAETVAATKSPMRLADQAPHGRNKNST